MTQLVTPPGWTPVNATAQELVTYGFPDRPTDAQALQEWDQQWKGFKGVAADPTVCLSTQLGFTAPTTSWSGRENTTSPIVWTHYTSAYGLTTTDPGFWGSCPTKADNGTWVGLGGDNDNNKLLQAGYFDDVYTTTNVMQGFYAGINHAGYTGAIYYSTPQINTGDVVETAVTYRSYPTYATTSFSVYDDATNMGIVNTGPLKTLIIPGVGQYGVSTFFDGSTADYINERSPGWDFQRPPGYGEVVWEYATANGVSEESQRSAVDTLLNLSKTAVIGSVSGYTGDSAWNDQWLQCS